MTRTEKMIAIEARLKELESQLITRLYLAARDLPKASADHFAGGGVILELTELGGRKIIKPVCIRDGLSAETIKAITGDLRRSFELATICKP